MTNKWDNVFYTGMTNSLTRRISEHRDGVAIGFSGFDGGAIKNLADICITVPFNSTPQVESFHLALEHLITFCLREKIEKENE